MNDDNDMCDDNDMSDVSDVSDDIPELIPPLFAAFPIINEFILESEVSKIPFNYGNDNGVFCTFMKKKNEKKKEKNKETKSSIILAEKIEDNSYLTMSLIDFNSYVNRIGLSNEQKKLYIHKRRQKKNREYSRASRLKKKIKSNLNIINYNKL
jgi:hypothetical protein